MTILNDKQIRQLSMTHTHILNSECSKLKLAEHDEVLYCVVSGEKMGTLEDMIKNPYFFEITDIHFRRKNPPMISPFVPTQVRKNEAGEKIISYGTSSMGYDVRLANKFKIFTNVFNALIDPLAMPENTYIDHEGDFVIIPPHSYVLGHTIEYFTMPEDVVAICVGKSTYARSGCAINVTPIEPGFCGNVVIEIANQTPLPMKVYSNQGIAQFLFLRGDPCETSYGARNGKYQGQTGIQTALV